MFMNNGITHRTGGNGAPWGGYPPQPPTSAGMPSDPNANAANPPSAPSSGPPVQTAPSAAINPNSVGNQMGSSTAPQPANPNPPSGGLQNALMSRMGAMGAGPSAPSPSTFGPFGGNVNSLSALIAKLRGQGQMGLPPAQPTPPQGSNPAAPQPSASPSQPVGV